MLNRNRSTVITNNIVKNTNTHEIYRDRYNGRIVFDANTNKSIFNEENNFIKLLRVLLL